MYRRLLCVHRNLEFNINKKSFDAQVVILNVEKIKKKRRKTNVCVVIEEKLLFLPVITDTIR